MTYQPAPHLLPLTASSLESYARCPALYELQYRHAMTRVGYSTALAVGEALHAAGAAIRKLDWARARPAAWDVMRARHDAAAPTSRDPDALRLQCRRDSLRLDAMIGGYSAWLTRGADFGRLSQIRTDSSEVQLAAPLRNPATGAASLTFYLRGIADGVIDLPDGQGGVLLYEMKTTSDTLDECEAWLRQTHQIPIYQYLLRETFGDVVAGCLVEIIKKPVAKKRTSGPKAETDEQYSQRCLEEYKADPDRFFRRCVFDYDARAIDAALANAWRIAAGIRDSMRHGFVALRGRNCKTSDGWCRYRELCWFAEHDGYAADADTRYSSNEGNGHGEQATQEGDTGNGCDKYQQSGGNRIPAAPAECGARA